MKILYKNLRLNKFLICMLLIFSFIGCSKFKIGKDLPDPEYCNYSSEITVPFSKAICERFNLTQYGSGGGFLENIRLICEYYEISRNLTLNEYRRLILTCAHDLLNRFNTNSKVIPYLARSPFHIKNIQITIRNFNLINGSSPKNTVIRASIVDGVIYYSTYDKELKRLKTVYHESYEDAVAKLQSKNFETLNPLGSHRQIGLKQIDAPSCPKCYLSIKQFSDKFSKLMEQIYQLKADGFGGAFDKEVKKVNLYYKSIGKRYNVDQARQLVMNYAERYLNLLNQSHTLSPFLAVNPFNLDRLNLSIAFFKDESTRFDPLAVSEVILKEKEIIYVSYDSDSKFLRKHLHEETYKQALENLQRHPLKKTKKYIFGVSD